MSTTTEPEYLNLTQKPHYSGIASTQIDKANKTILVDLQYIGRPCFSMSLLSSIASIKGEIEEHNLRQPDSIKYQVLHSSAVPGVFGLGGDLETFCRCIREQDRNTLRRYARLCIDVLYPTTINYGGAVTTIALIEGTAYGGAFEAALANSLIVAERGCQLGFPESLFGLFPGMGAYSFLARRVHPALAKRIITSGDSYTAEALYELGVIDILAEPGAGREAVEAHIKRAERMIGLQAMDNIVNRVFPITCQELYDITDLWVDTALCLDERNLRLMERFARSQAVKWDR